MTEVITIRPDDTGPNACGMSRASCRVELASDAVDDQTSLFDTLFAVCLDALNMRVVDVRIVPRGRSPKRTS